ncbi:MAG: DNA polymerase III subunit delta [Gammaproteobacteria bacterium]|nr:DNA polymerase III subunit delta [Gammaproteobacteria bacterium]
MKIRTDQLKQQLEKTLSPVYLISGDEPLQVMEAGDQVRAKARELGYTERTVMDVDKDFDWATLTAESNSLSLFAEQRILELRIPTGKPGKPGGAALAEYAARLPQDTILIISAGKLDKTATNTKWYKSLDSAGVTLQCWPIDSVALPKWIENRCIMKGMQPEKEAVRILVERVEGNMLAAAQEIEKLCLLAGSARLTAEQVTAAVADSSRFNIYDLTDAALAGDISRTSHIINGLQAEGVEVVLALWAVSREIRTLLSAAESSQSSADTALAKAGVWNNRLPLMKKALSRHNKNTLQQLLSRCANTDRVIKGLEAGKAWDELYQLCLFLAGFKLPSLVKG